MAAPNPARPRTTAEKAEDFSHLLDQLEGHADTETRKFAFLRFDAFRVAGPQRSQWFRRATTQDFISLTAAFFDVEGDRTFGNHAMVGARTQNLWRNDRAVAIRTLAPVVTEFWALFHDSIFHGGAAERISSIDAIAQRTDIHPPVPAARLRGVDQKNWIAGVVATFRARDDNADRPYICSLETKIKELREMFGD